MSLYRFKTISISLHGMTNGFFPCTCNRGALINVRAVNVMKLIIDVFDHVNSQTKEFSLLYRGYTTSCWPRRGDPWPRRGDPVAAGGLFLPRV